MMKRSIAMILLIVMFMSYTGVYADDVITYNEVRTIKNRVDIMRLDLDNAEAFVGMLDDLVKLVLYEFRDINKNDWFKENLALLYGMNIVQGDGMGNFLPNKQVSGSEYLKMAVVALDRRTYDPIGGLWDEPYIYRALALELVKSGELKNYSQPLNRYQMASIIVRACGEEFKDYEQYKDKIKDYSSIPEKYRESVLKAYSKGIINGLPDGTFGGDNTMKRSEAIAVIARLVAPSQRKVPVTPGGKGSNLKVTMENPEMQMIIDNIAGLAVPETMPKDTIFYAEEGKPSQENADLLIDIGSNTIYLTIAKNSPKTLSKAKEILKLFYPTSYERVYQAVINAYKKNEILTRTILDGRTAYVLPGTSAYKACVYIGRAVMMEEE